MNNITSFSPRRQTRPRAPRTDSPTAGNADPPTAAQRSRVLSAHGAHAVAIAIPSHLLTDFSSPYGFCLLITYTNRADECNANHFFQTACPTLVESGIFNQDRQIVAAPVMALLCTRRTTPHVFPADSPHFTYVVQN